MAVREVNRRVVAGRAEASGHHLYKCISSNVYKSLRKYVHQAPPQMSPTLNNQWQCIEKTTIEILKVASCSETKLK
jgi:hypothetical protein